MVALDLLEPRDVLLGRTTHVRRLLPHKVQRTIGAWCFLDHYGPDDIRRTGGMWVPPHPHTGLQTVTWLFEGLGRHLDSLGSDQRIRPGQLNVMTAGPGLCHAEISPDDAPDELHGVQLWVALPDVDRDRVTPAFDHVADLPTFRLGDATVTVLVGELAGHRSAAPAYTPLLGAELRLPAGAEVEVPLESGHEHGILAVDADLRVDDTTVARHELVYLGPGRPSIRMAAASGDAVVLLLGGAPFDERLVMWWNFVARSHEEIVEQRAAWNGSGADDVPVRFGQVLGLDTPRLLAPPLPTVRLRPR